MQDNMRMHVPLWLSIATQYELKSKIEIGLLSEQFGDMNDSSIALCNLSVANTKVLSPRVRQ